MSEIEIILPDMIISEEGSTIDKVIEKFGSSLVKKNVQVILPKRQDLSSSVHKVEDNYLESKIDKRILFVDGIQSCVLLKHVNFHPIYFMNTVAGAIDEGNNVVAREHEMKIITSKINEKILLADFNYNEIHLTDTYDPHDTAMEVERYISHSRENLEYKVVDRVSDRDIFTIVDGSIANFEFVSNVAGVVKSTSSKYLKNELPVFELEPGETSDIFIIKKTFNDKMLLIYTCYLRLFSNLDREWNYGLVRIESKDPGLLKYLGKVVYNNRQSNPYEDLRGDRHIAPIKNLEDILKYELPYIL